MTWMKHKTKLISIFVSLTMAIKTVHYLNPAFTKSNHIAKKKKKKKKKNIFKKKKKKKKKKKPG